LLPERAAHVYRPREHGVRGGQLDRHDFGAGFHQVKLPLMNKLNQFWSNLRGSVWLLPSLIVAGSLAVAVALIQVDAAGSQQWMAGWPRRRTTIKVCSTNHSSP
jgi:hypothetical protein